MFQLTMVGNLGGDPEMRYSSDGKPFLRFNVAGNIRVREADGTWADKTEWVRVTTFGQRAETLSQYLRKGSRVLVQGRLESRPWTDRDGNVRAGLEVVGDTVEFMTPRDQDAEYQSRQSGQQQAPTGRDAGDISDDDLAELPF